MRNMREGKGQIETVSRGKKEENIFKVIYAWVRF